jgi:GT2 family glycosyltransferase
MRGVGIVIVNYRTPGLVVDCLASLAADRRTGDDWRVVVVDSASGDGSVEQLRGAIEGSGWVELLPLAVNRGFAAGNNAALHRLFALPTPPEYYLLLNPDTVVRPGAVRNLADFLDRHPRVGLAGSRLENPDGSPQRSVFRFPGLLSELEGGLRLGLATRLLAGFVLHQPVPDRPGPADWLSGASLMVRRAVFEAVGLLDEGYFLYFEEVDFCRRARRAGWPCWSVPASRVVHLAGGSTGFQIAEQAVKRVPPYWFASRRRYFHKHLGPAVAFLADIIWATAFAGWRLRRRLQGKPDRDPPHYLGDFVRYFFLP